MSATDFRKRRVTVMGLGRFGGGIGVVNFLLQQGARVTLTDLQPEARLKESLARIDVSQLENLVLGEHRDCDFTDTDCLVINPGIVAEKNRLIRAAALEAIPITTEINLFWERCRAKIIVVTGTVGKSTTASLIHHFLTQAGESSHLGGNIGISLLSEVDEYTEDEWVVLELSSFQLKYLKSHHPQPDVSVVTNFYANHLDWHSDIADYRRAKQNALRWQTSENVSVINGDDPDVKEWATRGRRIEFGSSINANSKFVRIAETEFQLRINGNDPSISFSGLPGSLNVPHQRANIAAALAAVLSVCEASAEQLVSTLSAFKPLPHRMELVTERDGVQYVNDSKATTPEATMAALTSTTRPVVLIAGGKDKRVDITALCQSISTNVKAVALIGDTALIMALLLPEYRKGLLYSVHHDLASAYRWCRKQLETGDTLLLSPGCSSDSKFLNYEDRGNQFRRLVLET